MTTVDSILQFNKYNKDYYIKLKCYYGTDNDKDTAKQNFYNDLIMGEGADVFWLDSYSVGVIDVANLGSKGILADLYEFIDNDDNVSREDFVPNLLKQMEYEEGKLYAMYFKPSISFLEGKASVFDGCGKWNYETLLGIMQERPDSLLVLNNTREGMLKRFMKYSMGTFYDEKNGECSFDSDEFKAMLQILAMIPEKVDYALQDSLAEMLDNEEVLVYDGFFSHISISRKETDYFGDNDVIYLGVPTSGGAAEVNFLCGIAINEHSHYKQAAWEFVKYYLSEDFQRTDFLPTMNKYIDAEIEEYEKSKSDEQIIYYLLENCVGMSFYDADIYTIIDEEAQGYFAGVKSLDDTAATIQNRVQLYIDEMR